MADFVGHPFVQALAWTLVHFLWQGASIGIVALLLMRASRLPWTRYAIGTCALAVMLVAPLVTLLIQLSVSIVADARVSLAAALPLTAASTIVSDATEGVGSLRTGTPDTTLAVIVSVWLAGVVAFSLRLAGGWLVARRIAHQAVRPAAAEIQRLATAVGERLGVRRAVTVLESSLVAVPVMVGWLKPVIVLPVAALSGLTPDQLESLIAHELAHVRRHDFLVNLLQSIVEALLFYHPAVWWLSRSVRMERERCCDDVAVAVCDRLVYAEALKELAAMASPRFALAATDGDLLSRIRRVLGQVDDQSGRSSRWVPIVIVAATLVVAVQASFVVAAPDARDQARVTAVLPERVTQAPAEQKAQVEREWPTQTQDWTKQVEREWTRRLEADIEALGPAWEEALKRFQAEMERLQQSGEWQLMLDRLQEALSRMQAQSTERDQAAAAEQSMKQELERARAELDRTRALFERGLVSQTQMAEAEARLAAVSQRLAQDAQKHQLAQHLERQHEVEKTLKELAQHQKERSAEVEKMKREIEEHLKASRNSHAAEVENLRRAIDEHVKAGLKDRAAEMDQVKRAMDEHLKATLHDRAAEMEKVQQAMAEHLKATREARETEAAMLKHGRNLAPVEGPAAAGDVLEVRIGGEPDLPTHYDVRTDGTIRLPFLGSFKVVGQTAAQVQAAIGKQMADRKLGPANQVAVSVLRRR